MLQLSDFTCPTERSKKYAVFKNVNGKCYFITDRGCGANVAGGCTFQQAQDQCKTAFGAGIYGKVFEPTNIEDNDAVLKAANELDTNISSAPDPSSARYWIGVSNTPLGLIYKSNNKPVSISTIPWASGEPSMTASETQYIFADSYSLKWSSISYSWPYRQTICETSFPS